MTLALSRVHWLPAAGLLLLGSLGFAAAWILIGNRVGSLCSPLALVAALDAALLLHLARVRRARVLLALMVTLGAALLAIAGLVMFRAGQTLALSPWEVLQRLGLEGIALIAEMSVTQVDLGWLLAGAVLAVVLARR